MGSENRPLVSVVIPTYNRAHVLKRAVDSVLAQTYENIEVIIVDDGSTDNTGEVVASMTDRRIGYILRENAGACSARNAGASVSKGEYIAFQDSDDIWHADKLEKQMKVMLEKNPDVVVCRLVLKVDGEAKYPVPKRVGEGYVTLKNDFFGLGTQTVLVKKDVFQKEMFDPSMPRLQELEWLLRLIDGGHTVYCVGEGLADYEIGSDSISGNPEKLFRALSMLIEKYPWMRTYSPLMSMHACKDLVENRKRAREYGVDMREYGKLIRRWFPGVFRYFFSKIADLPGGNG